MWFAAISFIASIIVSYAFQPKVETRPPAGLDEIKVPTAEIGREIPTLFGTRKLEGPNVVWYGDLRTAPIKKAGGKK